MIKSKKIIVWLLAALPLIATLLLLPYLEDKVPINFDIHDQVTNWGSKYLTLISPFTVIAMFAIIEIIHALYAKISGKGENYQKALFILEISLGIVFIAIHVAILYLTFSKTSNSLASIDILKIVAIALSVFFIIIGNMLPKLKQNAIIGVRTTGTLKSQTVWFKTHRLSGFLVVASGITSLILTLFLAGFIALTITFFGFLAVVIYAIIYSSLLYQKEKAASNQTEQPT